MIELTSTKLVISNEENKKPKPNEFLKIKLSAIQSRKNELLGFSRYYHHDMLKKLKEAEPMI